jgi:hypothetical protein
MCYLGTLLFNAVILSLVERPWSSIVTISPSPPPKQTGSDKIAALKRRTRDFMGQPRSSDDVGLSYLESAEDYEYDTLAVRRMIAQ